MSVLSVYDKKELLATGEEERTMKEVEHPPVIEAKNLNLWYGEDQALKNIHLRCTNGKSPRLSDRPGAENRRSLKR